MIDTTDTLSSLQQQRLKNALNELRRTTPRYSRIALYAVDLSSEFGAKELADVCNPGDPSTADEWTENERLMATQYENLFDTPFFAALENLMGEESAPNSPIIEAIDKITVDTFGKVSGDATVRKTFIVVSDMLQNTAGLSMYRGVPSFDSYKSSAVFARHLPALNDVNVIVWEINRTNKPASISRSQLATFWSDFVTHFGGQVTLWDAEVL